MPNLIYELNARKKGFSLVGGVDEAGRGPLAGPVVAAAVILKKNEFKNRIDDSKLLSSLQREKAYREITECAIIGLGIISEKIIDSRNILCATNLAMENAIHSCVRRLKRKAKLYFLIDGKNMNLEIPYKFRCIVAGDKRSLSISAASIVAKVVRDRIMHTYDKIYPSYGFRQHKGYGTAQHILNLKRFGASSIHRKTFAPVSQLKSI